MSEEKKEVKAEEKKEVKKGRPVTVLQQKNGMALVEWRKNEHPHRNWVHSRDVIKTPTGETEVADPQAGIPYGFDFSNIVVPAVTAKDIDKALKMAGIWTLDDVQTKAAAVVGALQAAYGVDLAQILTYAQNYEREMKKE